MRIREATKHDVSIITEIIRGSFRDVAEKFGLTIDNCPTHPSNCRDDWILSDLLMGKKYFIIESDNPVGCIALKKVNEDLYYLERLGVIPLERKKGFGKILVNHIFEKVRELSGHKIGIGIICEHKELKEWYKRIGFGVIETKRFSKLPFAVTFMEYKLN